MIIEICCTSKASLYNSIEGGASRLELCEKLLKDGLTPSPTFLNEVLENTVLPVHVLIRPRSGNFVYTSEEVKTITTQIEIAKSFGAHGIVIGALNEDHSIAFDNLKYWSEIAQPLGLTFNRAFDHALKPNETLKKIMDLGFDRVLTSGQQTTAEEGLSLLKELQSIANEQLVVMPGGGVNDRNCELFFREGFKEIHLSAKSKDKTSNGEPISSLETIKKVVNSASNYTDRA